MRKPKAAKVTPAPNISQAQKILLAERQSREEACKRVVLKALEDHRCHLVVDIQPVPRARPGSLTVEGITLIRANP